MTDNADKRARESSRGRRPPTPQRPIQPRPAVGWPSRSSSSTGGSRSARHQPGGEIVAVEQREMASAPALNRQSQALHEELGTGEASPRSCSAWATSQPGRDGTGRRDCCSSKRSRRLSPPTRSRVSDPSPAPSPSRRPQCRQPRAENGRTGVFAGRASRREPQLPHLMRATPRAPAQRGSPCCARRRRRCPCARKASAPRGGAAPRHCAGRPAGVWRQDPAALCRAG
jgi:hypothetical protein